MSPPTSGGASSKRTVQQDGRGLRGGARPRLARAKAGIGAVRLQMLRYQVVGQLESFVSNRGNDFKEAVLGSTLDAGLRHQLLTINRFQAWFDRRPLEMKSGPMKGQVIPDDVRWLARRIMHGVMARHRRPRLHRLNPWIDQRQAELLRKAPGEGGAARSGLWAAIRGMERATGKTGRPLGTQANPAYSSQTCSACGFVAKTNRRSQSDFSCRACGHEIHADVNAARNLESGRSAFDRKARHTKAKSLELTVLRHLERLKTRGR